MYFMPKLFVFFSMKKDEDKELYIRLGIDLAYRSLWNMQQVEKIWWKFYKPVGKPFKEWNTRFQEIK